MVIKTTEKRKPKIYDGKQRRRERLMNKLTFYIDKLHLLEACCRSCFKESILLALESAFNSQASIPDTKGFGRGPLK